MKIFNMQRGHGKTTGLIITSFITGYRIITHSNQSNKYIINKAKEMGVKIPQPITYYDYHNQRGIRDEGLLIDDIDLMFEKVMQQYLNNIPIKSATMSIPEERFDYENKRSY